tara:strand:- start:103 stop:1128 length:1026 start_codon:yes stop_codon:yes gene_type:complete
MATIQDLFSSFLGNNNIDPAPELQERQNIFQKGIDKVGDTIQDIRFGNPLARTGDITSFVETDKGGTGFTDEGKKVSNLSSAELKFLKERNDELLRAQTGKGQPIISGVRDDDAKFKLYDPLQDYLTGSGSAGAFGNRAAQDMLMRQQVAGEPIVDALLRQKRVDAQAPSLESLRAVAMSPSVAEQEAMQEASKRRQATLDRDERLRAAQRTGDIDVIKAAQMQEFATPTPPTQTIAPQQSSFDQLSPTQLTYLMGQLGYDITPKQEKKTKPSEADTVEDVTSTSVSTSSTPLGALDLVRTFKANFDPSLLSARDLEAYNYALSNPQNPDSNRILVRLGAL